MNTTSIYGELNMDPESNRVQWAFKGLREHVVIMNSPPNAYPDQEIYIEIPRGSEGDVIIPQIPNVSFNLDIESSKDKARTAVNNVSRSLTIKKELLLGGKTINILNISNEYDTYKDLYMTSNERQDALLQGIQSEIGLKARLGATKVGDTALTLELCHPSTALFARGKSFCTWSSTLWNGEYCLKINIYNNKSKTFRHIFSFCVCVRRVICTGG